MAMLRSAMTNEAAMGMMRDLLVREVFGPITETLGVPDAELRATLVGSQFIGLAMMRYIARIEPLASASVDELVAAIGPTVQRYLAEPLTRRPEGRRRLGPHPGMRSDEPSAGSGGYGRPRRSAPGRRAPGPR